MPKFSAVDVPDVVKDVIVSAINAGDYLVALTVTALADLQREYPGILLDGSSRQIQTWKEYLPELQVALVVDNELYAGVVDQVYDEYFNFAIKGFVEEFLSQNFPGAEESEWSVTFTDGLGEPVTVSSDGFFDEPQKQIVLTDLPEPKTTYADAEPGSVYDNEALLDQYDREEKEAEAFLREHPDQEEKTEYIDVEAQADNVVPFPTVTPEDAPTQPKHGC